ncbi:MAG TPA: hypothetical protein VMV02_03130 [Acidimicrobiales bacterium]|nr:hypothetical protein [Acidimicrobiales bacterium]HVC26160.1 hypothetical protein [Acidimicrobiales bacterium]
MLGVAEGLIAVGGIAGSVGLAANSLDLGAEINGRLPFDSPVFAGGALFVIVGVPMTVAARAAWLGHERHADLAMGAGALLTGWIVVEVAVIRSFSWLQPVFFAAGLAVFYAGYRTWCLKRDARAERVASATRSHALDAPCTPTPTRSIGGTEERSGSLER